MDRKAFLERVRQAARVGRTHRVTSDDSAHRVGYVGESRDLCLRLAREIEDVGGQARVVGDDDEARSVLAEWLQQRPLRSALCWQHPLLERIQVDRLLEEIGATAWHYDSLVNLPAEDQRRTLLEAEIGISSVDYAVAETGTLVVCSQPGQERVVSLLPPGHLAVVQESQIVPDLFDVFEQLESSGLDSLASNLACITGPSKTGDIELQLTTGVHGPGSWQVIIIRQSG